MNITTFGLDIAKNVMQVLWVDEQTEEIGRRVLKRSQLAPFFARQAHCRIVLEAIYIPASGGCPSLMPARAAGGVGCPM